MTQASPRIRVLVLDDEKVVRLVIRTALQRPGVEVVEAHDGSTALQELERGPFHWGATKMLYRPVGAADTVAPLLGTLLAAPDSVGK